MSLTTVAAPVRPDAALLNLPPSHPERFLRSDFIAAGLVFLITLGVYIATLAPNVTLEDSGELITAATKFGVGHPPGYPLWTISGFILSHIFPFGNLAWRINLLCALFGATSNAVLTLLTCHSGRWFLQRWIDSESQPVARRFVFFVGLFAGLTIGFSNVMWSQAVISAVHGTIQALILNIELLLFYLWMLDPKKTYRLILTVFVFALGLTNHHTLVQIIPAFLLAALLIRAGKFWAVFLSVNLFSLSILVYISWLSGDGELQTISLAMAKLILGMTALVSFFYLKQFRLHLFLLGVATAVAIFAYGFYLLSPNELEIQRYPFDLAHLWRTGSYIHDGWLQTLSGVSLFMLGLAALALGLLYTSNLDRRLIIAFLVVGWLGLIPYSYEPFASNTHPPMNWGYTSERSGFYYAVSREQYPKSLPVLIKSTIGKAIGVVPRDEQLDATIELPNYFPRLGLTFYYYIANLLDNFTVPLVFLTLAFLLYVRRCDRPQVNWLIFLGAALFFLAFMLQLIAPQEAFDFERNLQYIVFHLQSHCILVLLMSYGALAAMAYLHDMMPEVAAKTGPLGFGAPILFLSLLPFWSNFDSCCQAGHWFGYDFGADIMRPLDKDSVYYGGSDPGRFVPTYMAFVESQQSNRWKRESGFDRRDVTVITQNALCDSYYSQYIRDQYDPRFRPDQFTPFEKWLGRDKAYPTKPVVCMSDDELQEAWAEYRNRNDVQARLRAGGPLLRSGTNDVFDVNAIVSWKIFEKNKKDRTFYLEQSIPMDWTYPYLIPSGLIFKINPDPVDDAHFAAYIAEDKKFWATYSTRLLQDPRFRADAHATLVFAKLAFWHADLYRYRKLDKEQEYWLKMSLALCPQLASAVSSLAHLYASQFRYDDALAVVNQAEIDDPRNQDYASLLDWTQTVKILANRESDIRDQLKKTPNDVLLNLELARVFEDEGKFNDVNAQLRMTAAMSNDWSHPVMAEIVQYYVDKMHNPLAAIAFLETRAKITPKEGELVYSLAALHGLVGHADDAIKYLTQSATVGGTNALYSAQIDPRFDSVRNDPRFRALLSNPPSTNAPAVQAPATNSAPSHPATPKKHGHPKHTSE
ncbi:MAG: DUF2723 domain-containing protein [Methylacidiphilales bacterium]|nr:DUF2723 domain-containing protein [Candidatus Methylacidiphilales bacterium]